MASDITHEGGSAAPATAWRKSTKSIGNGACVEIAELSPEVTAIRDSKDKSGPQLHLPQASFRAFVSDVKAGGFDI
jgi:hypothetical protein